MIDQDLFATAIAFYGVLIGVGAVVLLALAAWAVRSPLSDWVQHRNASRELRKADDAFNSSHTPHPAH